MIGILLEKKVQAGMDKETGVEITDSGDVAVVSFKATSISNSEEIVSVSEQIKNFIEEKHPKKIVFDFEMVKFFSSQVLGVLLDIRAKSAEWSGEVVISAIEPQLHRVFKITNLDQIFRFFPDRKSAVIAVSKS